MDTLNKAYDGLVPRNLARELLIDFGTTTSAVSDVSKLSGDGGLTTIGTNIIQGLPNHESYSHLPHHSPNSYTTPQS